MNKDYIYEQLAKSTDIVLSKIKKANGYRQDEPIEFKVNWNP